MTGKTEKSRISGRSVDKAPLPGSYYLALVSLAGRSTGAEGARRRAMAHLQAIAARLEAATQKTAQRFGIHVTDVYVLMLLYRSGEGTPVRPLDIQRAIGFTAGGMTRRLDSLAERALVRRIANPEDGRSWLVELTEAGQAMAAEIFRSSRNRTSLIGNRLGPDDWVRLEQTLATINEAMG